MRKEIEDIVKRYREEGDSISDKDVEEVTQHCIRKMDVSRIDNKEEYLPLLFEDELNHFLVRKTINVITILREMAKEADQNVCVMQAISV